MPAKRRKRKSKPLTGEQQAIVEANRGLIGVATRGMTFRNMSTYDQGQEGVVALANAVRGYDPKKDVRFSTYAVRAIRNTLSRRDQEWDLIHVPHYLRTEEGKRHRYQEYAKAVDGRISMEDATKNGWNPSNPDDEDTEFGWQAMRAVSWAVRKLPLDERRVIRGLVIRGESVQRVSGRYGLTQGQVKKIKMRAIANLRATLAKHV